MSQLLPPASPAESQKLHALQILHMGFQKGAETGAIISLPVYCLGGASLLPQIHPSRLITRTYPRIMLRSMGYGSVIGMGVMAGALTLEVVGRNDQGWRFERNGREMEENGVSAIGSVAGLYLARQGDWKIKVGGAALGNLGGVLGYEIWRWGVRREEGGL